MELSVTFSLKVEKNDTLKHVEETIEDEIGVSRNQQQRLIHPNKEFLVDDKTLIEYNIDKELALSFERLRIGKYGSRRGTHIKKKFKIIFQNHFSKLTRA